MKKYKIEDLAAGRVATFINYRSETSDLEKLLKLAFPEDNFDAYESYLMDHNDDYYFANTRNKNFWSSYSFRETDLPTQHVKYFLTDLEEEWEPKQGEICLVKYCGKHTELEFLAKTDYAKNSTNENTYIFYNPEKTKLVFSKKEGFKPLPPKIKLTIQEIADKFGVDVDRLEVVND